MRILVKILLVGPASELPNVGEARLAGFSRRPHGMRTLRLLPRFALRAALPCAAGLVAGTCVAAEPAGVHTHPRLIRAYTDASTQSTPIYA